VQNHITTDAEPEVGGWISCPLDNHSEVQNHITTDAEPEVGGWSLGPRQRPERVRALVRDCSMNLCYYTSESVQQSTVSDLLVDVGDQRNRMLAETPSGKKRLCKCPSRHKHDCPTHHLRSPASLAGGDIFLRPNSLKRAEIIHCMMHTLVKRTREEKVCFCATSADSNPLKS
jgi:hypothetical protein